ncbi:MAG: PASTA domain-containing protein [bacterium]|nr:PASTA domain-containing protein [bacterium]
MISLLQGIGRAAARVLVILLTWAVLILVVDKVALPFYTRKFTESQVPKLTGLPLYEATQAAEHAGYKVVRERSRPDAKALPETVVEQRPSSSGRAKAGRTIYVTVAARAAQVSVPNLFELSPREAELKIDESGLTYLGQSSEFVPSDLIAPGFVARQEPSAGTLVKLATPVRIFLSSGPEEGKATVPDLSGMTIEQAASKAMALGFILSEPMYERSLSVSEGRVLRHTPEPATVVARGTYIDLIVSSGK